MSSPSQGGQPSSHPQPSHQQPPSQLQQYSAGPPTGTLVGSSHQLGVPAPTRSNTSVLIAIVIAVLVIGGGLSGWLLAGHTYDKSTAQGAAAAFVDAVNSHNVDAVKELVCSQAQDSISGAQSVSSIGTLKLDSVSEQGDQATAKLELVTNIGNQSLSVPMDKNSQNGRWQLCPESLGNN
ncbi:MAG: hypothetical protein M3Y77_13285 [Actinomycetota bacterium]|nr:hypothetical protein [Actinomycetota bacterium]